MMQSEARRPLRRASRARSCSSTSRTTTNALSVVPDMPSVLLPARRRSHLRTQFWIRRRTCQQRPKKDLMAQDRPTGLYLRRAWTVTRSGKARGHLKCQQQVTTHVSPVCWLVMIRRNRAPLARMGRDDQRGEGDAMGLSYR